MRLPIFSIQRCASALVFRRRRRLLGRSSFRSAPDGFHSRLRSLGGRHDVAIA